MIISRSGMVKFGKGEGEMRCFREGGVGIVVLGRRRRGGGFSILSVFIIN